MREVEAAFERQQEKDRRAAEDKEVEVERLYREHLRKWEKEERCVVRVPAAWPCCAEQDAS